MPARTDVHSPANINPADYEFLTDFYIGTDEDAQDAYKFENRDWQWLMEANATVSQRSSCHHCGTYYAYGVCYRYLPTGELLNVGHVCAANTLSLPDRVAINRRNAERAVAAAKERAARTAKVEAFLNEHPLIKQLDQADRKSSFVADVLSKLRQYGELSERQVAALEKVAVKVEAQKEAEAELPTAPCPSGRVQVTGTVIAIKEVDKPKYSHYDSDTTFKMLVRDDTGFKVWGTRPYALYTIEVGSRVTFSANLEVSQQDSTFGFFKRPTKPAIL